MTLNVTAAELLAEPIPLAQVISASLDRAGGGVAAHRRVHDTFRRSGLSDEILNAMVSPNPLLRAAAARLCGALRLSEAIPWIADLLEDPNSNVRRAAAVALGQAGGRRAVEILIAAEERIPLYRQAIAVSRAASEIDIEALMRQPKNERVAVVTVLACGLRHDVLRVPPLLGIAHDRRWPVQVRVAACRSLGMIGDPSATEGLARLAESDPIPAVKTAAGRAQRRLQNTASVTG